jgi:tetratricopeptide (TPR) repeat protein
MLILLGRHFEALEILKDVELDSEIDWRAYHVLALSKLKAGQTETAIKDLLWASKNTPWLGLRVMFESSLGYAYLRQGQRRVAVGLFEGNLLRAAQSKRQGLLLFLGKAFQEMGQYDRSKNCLRRASPTDKSTELLLRSMGDTVNGTGAEQIEVAEFDVLLAA